LANDPEIAALLLEASADPNITDLAGNSPVNPFSEIINLHLSLSLSRPTLSGT
jgi:hypothetical protein